MPVTVDQQSNYSFSFSRLIYTSNPLQHHLESQTPSIHLPHLSHSLLPILRLSFLCLGSRSLNQSIRDQPTNYIYLTEKILILDIATQPWF